LHIPQIDHRGKLIMSLIFLTSRKTVSARQEHSCVANLKGDVDLLSDVEGLSENREFVESEVSAHLSHALSNAMHKPTRSARRAAVRFETEGVDECAFVLLAFLVVGPVSELSGSCVLREVSGARGAHDGDVEGDGAGSSEVVDDDVAWALVVSWNHTANFVVDNDAGGLETAGEGVGDVFVALIEEAGLSTGGLVDAVGVVEMATEAAQLGAIDNSQSKLHKKSKLISEVAQQKLISE
jgi:hypothetical protein